MARHRAALAAVAAAVLAGMTGMTGAALTVPASGAQPGCGELVFEPGPTVRLLDRDLKAVDTLRVAELIGAFDYKKAPGPFGPVDVPDKPKAGFADREEDRFRVEVRDPAADTPTIEARMLRDLKVARECYAQAGIRLALAGGKVDFKVLRRSAFRVAAGWSYSGGNLATLPDFSDTVLVSDLADPTVLAHELGHTMAQNGSHDTEPESLMTAVSATGGGLGVADLTITTPRRLGAARQAAFRANEDAKRP